MTRARAIDPEAPIPAGFLLVLQGLLFEEACRRLPRPVLVRVPTSALRQPHTVPGTVENLCRELQLWRNWQVYLRRRIQRHPEDDGLKQWYAHTEKRLRWLEGQIWALWYTEEKQPRRTQHAS